MVLALAAGCSSSASPDAASIAPPTGGAGTGTSDDGLPTSLEFEMVPALAARQTVSLNVRATPPRSYQVRFALPTTDGDPLDAVLDRSEGTTDAKTGIASVLLTAPSSPPTFELRASVETVAKTLPLTVVDRGVATLQVTPDYPSGLRDIKTWVATAFTEKTCADVPGIPPEDGPLKAPPAAKMEAPVISEVPAGTRLAVTLRSGHYVGGCTSVEMLPPGPPERPQIVTVTVLNRPIDLSTSSLAFSLDLAPPAQTWSSSLNEAGRGVLSGILGTSADDVDALLDAMRQASGDSLQSFESTRKAEGWDAILRGRWGQNAANKLQNLASAWLAAGRDGFLASPHPFMGSLTPLSQPSNADATSAALLTLETVAGVDPTDAGFVAGAQASWSASPDDTILLSTDLYFVRSQLAAALAEATLLANDSSVVSVPDALAQALDCDGLADALAAAGTDTTVAYDSCDGACLADTCRTAMTALWQRGAEVDGADFSRLNVTATGTALVGDAAELIGLTGSWIGQITDQSGTRATGGALTAATPTEAR